jgi:hypothetical protein
VGLEQGRQQGGGLRGGHMDGLAGAVAVGLGGLVVGVLRGFQVQGAAVRLGPLMVRGRAEHAIDLLEEGEAVGLGA